MQVVNGLGEEASGPLSNLVENVDLDGPPFYGKHLAASTTFTYIHSGSLSLGEEGAKEATAPSAMDSGYRDFSSWYS
jgi:hypothetical protein